VKYIYVYTADNNKFERLKKAIDYIEKNNLDLIFAVNDLQSIAYLKEKGYKALNIDAIVDLFNLLKPEESVVICTPEDATYVKASFRDVKEICNE
jgi:hypothetical protein